jgi:hypothetical protein
MSNDSRRRYVKPVVESVTLVPDEAVLGGCKTSNGGGQNVTGSSCFGNNCSEFDASS